MCKASHPRSGQRGVHAVHGEVTKKPQLSSWGRQTLSKWPWRCPQWWNGQVSRRQWVPAAGVVLTSVYVAPSQPRGRRNACTGDFSVPFVVRDCGFQITCSRLCLVPHKFFGHRFGEDTLHVSASAGTESNDKIHFCPHWKRCHYLFI